MIQTVKQNEQARQEYRFMSGFEMDARDKGFAEGSYQKAIETAKIMKNMNYPLEDIYTITGLSKEEVGKL